MYKHIKENTSSFEVKQMCDAFTIPRCSYYAWLNRGISKRKREDIYYAERITTVFKDKKQKYGSPRITAELGDEGLRVGKDRVCRLMKIQGLTADRKKKRKYVNYASSLREPAAGNLVNMNFNPRAANGL